MYDYFYREVSDCCHWQQYVIVVPYTTSERHINLALGEKSGLLVGWLAVAVGFAALRCGVGEFGRHFGALLVDSMGRSIGVGVAAAPQTPAEAGQRWQSSAAAAAVLRGSLNAFVLVFTTFYSSWLFEQYVGEVGGERRIRCFEDLFNDTTNVSLPMNVLYVDRWLFDMYVKRYCRSNNQDRLEYSTCVNECFASFCVKSLKHILYGIEL